MTSEGAEDRRAERVRDLVQEAMEDLKAVEIATLPIGGQSTIADYFMVCTGTSETHCRAIADEIARRLKAEGLQPLNAGEPGSGAWTLLDYGAVVVHVFSREARSRYDLEGAWGRRPTPGPSGTGGRPVG
jgi:ribosome-associated protein